MPEWILAGTLVALQVPDVLTTNAILASGGRELNPVIRICMRMGGNMWWVPKMALVLALAPFIAASGYPEAQGFLIALNVLYLGVVASNLRQLRRLERVRVLRGS